MMLQKVPTEHHRKKKVPTEHHIKTKSSYGASSERNIGLANRSLPALMARGVSPRDVPKDERSKKENKYSNLAVGDRIKFQLPELGMQCPNAQITKLKPVLVAAVASGIEHVWEADSRPSPPSRVYCAGTR